MDLFKAYNLEVLEMVPLTKGTVQQNYKLMTPLKAYVLRVSNRTYEANMFEVSLLNHLVKDGFNVPKPIATLQGDYILVEDDTCYMVFDYIEGEHRDQHTDGSMASLIDYTAKLDKAMIYDIPEDGRLNYSKASLIQLVHEMYEKHGKKEKMAWLLETLDLLEGLDQLPRGICHCDLNLSNILFDCDQVIGLIDFDDACMTYRIWDLISLIHPYRLEYDWHSWQDFKDEIIDLEASKRIIRRYHDINPLSEFEKRHLYDVYIITILFDAIWYYDRGDYPNFYEKHKLDAFIAMGRQNFYRSIWEE